VLPITFADPDDAASGVTRGFCVPVSQITFCIRGLNYELAAKGRVDRTYQPDTSDNGLENFCCFIGVIWP
jgi:hypothetical protein